MNRKQWYDKPEKYWSPEDWQQHLSSERWRRETKSYNKSERLRPLRPDTHVPTSDASTIDRFTVTRREEWNRRMAERHQLDLTYPVDSTLYRHAHPLAKLIWDFTERVVIVPNDVTYQEYRRIQKENREFVPDDKKKLYDEVSWLLFKESGLDREELTGLRPKIIEEILNFSQ